MQWTELIQLAKLIVELGMGAVMAAVVAGAFVYMLKYMIPDLTRLHQLALERMEDRHKEDYTVARTDFLSALADQRKLDREANVAMREDFLQHLAAIEQRVMERHGETKVRLERMESAVHEACKYKPRS